MNDHIRCIRARIFNSTGMRKVNDVTSYILEKSLSVLKRILKWMIYLYLLLFTSKNFLDKIII